MNKIKMQYEMPVKRPDERPLMMLSGKAPRETILGASKENPWTLRHCDNPIWWVKGRQIDLTFDSEENRLFVFEIVDVLDDELPGRKTIKIARVPGIVPRFG